MPNWIEHEFHVVGSKPVLDRFIKAGCGAEELHFRRLCPLKRAEPRDTYKIDSALVNAHFRTDSQAFFAMVTAWDYAPEFYRRLPRSWPDLAFASAINGELGDFGGVIMVLNGKHVDLVRDYDAKYDRRKHARDVRRVLERWAAFLTKDREWRLVQHAPWEKRLLPFDAHFDDDFWFYFKSREEMAAFRKRYQTSFSSRRVNGRWQRTR